MPSSTAEKTSEERLKKGWPAVRSSGGSTFWMPWVSSSAARASTAALVGSRTWSSRRATTSGKITRPYSERL